LRAKQATLYKKIVPENKMNKNAKKVGKNFEIQKKNITLHKLG